MKLTEQTGRLDLAKQVEGRKPPGHASGRKQVRGTPATCCMASRLLATSNGPSSLRDLGAYVWHGRHAASDSGQCHPSDNVTGSDPSLRRRDRLDRTGHHQPQVVALGARG